LSFILGFRDIDGCLLQALPSSFVQRHGDKIRQSVTLRTLSSTKSWPVTVSICVRPPNSTQVHLSGGWRAFADFNGLLVDDLLIFSLTAMSEFKVYVFRSSGSPRGFPTQVQRKWARDSEISQKKATKQSDAQLLVDGSVEGRVLSGLHMAKKTIVAEERAAEISKSVSKLRNSLINHQTGSFRIRL
jgi:hypothetical protein